MVVNGNVAATGAGGTGATATSGADGAVNSPLNVDDVDTLIADDGCLLQAILVTVTYVLNCSASSFVTYVLLSEGFPLALSRQLPSPSLVSPLLTVS